MISSIELLAIAAALVFAAWVVHRQRPDGVGLAIFAVIIGGTLAGALIRNTVLVARTEARTGLLAEVPRIGREDNGFAGSDSCQACHPREYATWHASFHRTMTQLATPQTVVGPFDDVTLEAGGYTYHLSTNDEQFFVETTDFAWELARLQRRLELGPIATRPRAKKRIVMTTGSHWMQTYWYASDDGRELVNFPFVYMFADARWIPREDVFLRPPDAEPLRQRWNDNCLGCHTTFGQPKQGAAGWDTRVAELGIACEVCHGPGREHVDARRSPLARYASYLGADGPDPTIVNPARLDAARSSEVCGQCHSKSWFNDFREFNANGIAFRPGGQLAESKTVVLPRSRPEHPWLVKSLEMDPAFADQFFWSDGMVRVSGREYNGMVESKCFGGGEMSCLSCHGLHGDQPEAHPHPTLAGDNGCLACHESYARDVVAHTHHAADSSGSSCVNCHMPYTSYGLLKGLRSHLIDVPTVSASVATGRPNACNNCHLDRPLGWTAEHLQNWYAIASPELAADDREVAASVRAVLEGDAGQRALAAWVYSWSPALAASGNDWQAPHLAVLLEDPYSAVRYIAARSLRGLPGLGDLDLDFLASPEQRETDVAAVRALWRPTRTEPAVLIGADGLDHDEQRRRLGRRDDRPVDLRE